jgi:hypothetical protein
MSAITVRGLPDDAHANLRLLAAAKAVSVESMARDALVAVAQGTDMLPKQAGIPGMAEQMMPWPALAEEVASFESLWGALKGKVHIAPGVDISAPAGEGWNAEAGTI